MLSDIVVSVSMGEYLEVEGAQAEWEDVVIPCCILPIASLPSLERGEF